MISFVYAKDGRACRKVLEENGVCSIYFNNGELKHGIPTTDVVTEPEYKAWVALHPPDKPYLHEVLEVVAEAKRHPRLPEESDPDWMAALRSQAALRFEVRYKDQDKFIDQYTAATGETSTNLLSRPGVYLHREGANKWYSNAFMTFPNQLPEGCPVEVHTELGGGFAIRNTRFIWSLISREGFRLDP